MTYLFTMEVNYFITVPVLIVVIIMIVYLIRRNRRDQKKFEKEIIESESKPEKHDDDHA